MHSTAQHSTAQHSTAQHNTAQHSTAQHSHLKARTHTRTHAQKHTHAHTRTHAHTHTHTHIRACVRAGRMAYTSCRDPVVYLQPAPLHLHRDWAHPLPHLHWGWAHPLPHLLGMGSSRPHLHRDRRHLRRIRRTAQPTLLPQGKTRKRKADRRGPPWVLGVLGVLRGTAELRAPVQVHENVQLLLVELVGERRRVDVRDVLVDFACA
jgi:hypothetical protein